MRIFFLLLSIASRRVGTARRAAAACAATYRCSESVTSKQRTAAILEGKEGEMLGAVLRWVGVDTAVQCGEGRLKTSEKPDP